MTTVTETVAAAVEAANLFDQKTTNDDSRKLLMDTFLSKLSEQRQENITLLSNRVTQMKRNVKKLEAGGLMRRQLPRHERNESNHLPVFGFVNKSHSVMKNPFAFHGEVSTEHAVIAFDCEGIQVKDKTTKVGFRTSAATIVFVRGSTGQVLLSSFIKYEEHEVHSLLTHITNIEMSHLKKSPITLAYMQTFLLNYFLKYKPTIIGWNIMSDITMLGMQESLKQLYGSQYYTRVIDLQSQPDMLRRDFTNTGLKIFVEEFKSELSLHGIQKDTHQAVEDARATLLLYNRVYLKRHEFPSFFQRIKDMRTTTKEERDANKRKWTLKKTY